MSGRDLKFIVDQNAGKLVRWLRMMGYDTVFFAGPDDFAMVAMALREERVLLTRDTGIGQRRVAVSGRLKVVLLASDDPEAQIRHLVARLDLDCRFRPFTRCLECNQPLRERTKEDVQGRVPPYVLRTQDQYRECPACHRIYWRGTHWQAMTRKLESIGRS